MSRSRRGSSASRARKVEDFEEDVANLQEELSEVEQELSEVEQAVEDFEEDVEDFEEEVTKPKRPSKGKRTSAATKGKRTSAATKGKRTSAATKGKRTSAATKGKRTSAGSKKKRLSDMSYTDRKEFAENAVVKANELAKKKRSGDTQGLDGAFTLDMLRYKYGNQNKVEGETNRCKDFMEALSIAKQQGKDKIVNPHTGRPLSLSPGQNSGKLSPTLLKVIRDCSKYTSQDNALPAEFSVATKDAPLDLENPDVLSAIIRFFETAAQTGPYTEDLEEVDDIRTAGPDLDSRNFVSNLRASFRKDLKLTLLSDGVAASINAISSEEVQRICDIMMGQEVEEYVRDFVKSIFFLFYYGSYKGDTPNSVSTYRNLDAVLDEMYDINRNTVILKEGVRKGKGNLKIGTISTPKFGSNQLRALFVHHGESYYYALQSLFYLIEGEAEPELSALLLYNIYNDNASALAAAKGWKRLKEKVVLSEYTVLKPVSRNGKMVEGEVKFHNIMRTAHNSSKFYNPFNAKSYNVSTVSDSDNIGMMEEVQQKILDHIFEILPEAPADKLAERAAKKEENRKKAAAKRAAAKRASPAAKKSSAKKSSAKKSSAKSASKKSPGRKSRT